tara:strand:- start:19612 stop:20658 length:1047 start_codon:yes stop_codon:yes gene_type:complete
MKFYKSITVILIVFIKTGNVLSYEDIFNVNNIELVKKAGVSSQELTKKAIKKGFIELQRKILLKEESKKLSQLDFSQINNLVSYYQIVSKNKDNEQQNKVIYNIFFDKEKLHNIFYKKNISYSEIIDKEIYLIPIHKKENKIYIFNRNFFYEKWNEIYKNDLIEIILPVENIESIQYINSNQDNLFNIDLEDLFKEYKNKNLVLILIEDTNLKQEKIYLRMQILSKKIDKALVVKKSNITQIDFYKKIINETSKELENIIKSQNLIDVRIPSFLNTKLFINKKNNLAELNRRLKNIGLIENIFVQELNSEHVLLKIKYLGKLDKIISQLKKQNIILNFENDLWSIKIL